MKKNIPNFLTSMNILCGSIACMMAINHNYWATLLLICIAAIFDFFDGFSARLLKAYSPIGKELDSLADVISFGLAPTLLVFNYLDYNINGNLGLMGEYIPYLSFLLVIFSALRLAKFNIDERQTSTFIGLPTPANALFWICLIYGLDKSGELIRTMSIYPITGLILIFSLLMTSEIPMFSLKAKTFSLKNNELRYLLIVFIIVATVIWGILGISVGIIFYILISIISLILKKKQKL